MRPYRFHPAARDELREAARWYEEHDAGVGFEMLAAFRAKLDMARAAPSAGRLVGTTRTGIELRSFRLDRFDRYAIVVAVHETELFVVALEHSSRRPGLWRGRSSG